LRVTMPAAPRRSNRISGTSLVIVRLPTALDRSRLDPPP
jgi:hypothetical protein